MMKKLICILFVLHSSICVFAQGKKNVSSIVCNVVCTTDFEVSGKPLAGTAGSMNNKKLYVYKFEDVPYGEYTIIVKKDKFVAKPCSVSVSQKNVNTTLFLDMFTR